MSRQNTRVQKFASHCQRISHISLKSCFTKVCRTMIRLLMSVLLSTPLFPQGVQMTSLWLSAMSSSVLPLTSFISSATSTTVVLELISSWIHYANITLGTSNGAIMIFSGWEQQQVTMLVSVTCYASVSAMPI